MRRLLAVTVLSSASVLFALRFTPPPTGVVTAADDPSVYEVTTTTSPGFVPAGPTTTTTLPPGVRLIEGPMVRMNRGVVQVAITLRYGTMTDIEMIRWPMSSRRATQISLDAEPHLEAEALDAQSARIHVVTGATETSYAYIRSLRDAIEEARLSSDR